MPPTKSLQFFVNGEKVTVDDVHPNQTLLEFLRNDLQLCGTKLGCGEGGCGACTVMLSRLNKTSHLVEHRSIVSCLTPVCSLHGAAVTTIEGVGSTKTKLHPIQQALAHGHGTQCGYCSPGMVMSMCSLLQSNLEPQLRDIEDAVQGNLCRCTGYRPIMECFRSFAKDGPEPGSLATDNLALVNDDHYLTNDQPAQQTSSPKRGPLCGIFHRKVTDSGDPSLIMFENKEIRWFQPSSMDKLTELKEKHPEGILVAGNTQVGLRMKLQHEQFPILISVMGIPELNVIKPTTNGVEFGAAVSLTALENYAQSLLETELPYKVAPFAAMVKLFRTFTGRQIKNMSTVGGTIIASLATADMIPVCLAANATIRIATKGSTQDIALEKLFSAENGKRPLVDQKEIVVALTIPFTTENEYMAAFKQMGRQATTKSCMKVEFDGRSEKVHEIRLAFAGVGARPMLAVKTMKALKGLQWNDSLLKDATHLLEEEFPSNGIPNKFKYQTLLVTGYFFKFYCMVLKELQKNQIAVKSGVSMPSDTMDTAATVNKPKLFKTTQFFPEVPSEQPEEDAVGRPLPHKFCEEHTTGEAVYCDDMPRFKNELYLALVLSTKAHANIVSLDTEAASAMDDVKLILTAKDLPGDRNCYGAMNKDDVVYAEDKVTCVGQPIAAVIGKDKNTAQAAARAIVIQYEDIEPALLTIEDAINANSFLDYENNVEDGDVDSALTSASQVIEGEVLLPGQKHFYMETHSVLVVPKKEKGDLEIFATTQDLTIVQMTVAHALGLPAHHIICRIKRLGGSFGGKSTRGISLFVSAALAAQKLQLPIRCKLDRQQDMVTIGGRHPYLAKYKVGVSPEGIIEGLDLKLFSDAGNSTDLSTIIMIFTVTASDNCYKIPNIRIAGKCCRTNMASNTAFRGFGGLQGFTIIEYIVDHIATDLMLDPVKVREINMYKAGDLTFYQEELTNVTLDQCWQQCLQQSNYQMRRQALESFNRNSEWRKRGMAIVPLRFGVGFPVAFLNQGCALVNVYTDGSVLLSHGGIEMGQGLHTKMIQVASRALQIPDSKIYTVDNSTDRLPNAVVTAASTGSDLNGEAIRVACETILERLEPFKEANPEGKWEDWVTAAYFDRVSLSATGFFKTPGLDFDHETKRGQIFSYDTYGVGCTEVELDCLTGDHKIVRGDIVMDAGVSLNPALDIGQLEGAFMQGYGYFITEDVQYTSEGVMTTTGPRSYRIPTFKDIPEELNISLMEGSSNPKAIYSSKSIGEPSLCLSASIYFAVKDAISAARKEAGLSSVFQLDIPAIPEKVRLACSDQLLHELLQRTDH